jgi:hypothetical protein
LALKSWAFIQPVALPYLVSRCIVLGTAILLQWLLDTGYLFKLGYIGDAPLATLSATFDANWYGMIATGGYSTSADFTQPQNYHFFPLYPLLMRLTSDLAGLGTIDGGYYFMGVLLSHAFFLVALGLLYKLTVDTWRDTTIARKTIWLICVLPWAHVFSMTYTESLFLMLTAAALLVAYDNRLHASFMGAASAGVLAGLATLTRPQGFVVGLAVVWLVGLVPRDLSLNKRIMHSITALLPSIVAALGFALYVAIHTGSGNILAIQQTTTAWGTNWIADLPRLFSLPPANPMWFLDMQATLTLLLWAAAMILLFIQVYRFNKGAPSIFNASFMSPRASIAFLIYTAGSLLLTLLGNPMNIGWGRYMLATFPLVWLIATYLTNSGTFRRVAMVAMGSQVLFMFSVVIFQFTP